jgi:hypothetical protein
MEKLVINIPEKKSSLVKQILKELGVTIQPESHLDTTAYKKSLLKVSTWSSDDLKVFEESKKAFDNLEPGQW